MEEEAKSLDLSNPSVVDNQIVRMPFKMARLMLLLRTRMFLPNSDQLCHEYIKTDFAVAKWFKSYDPHEQWVHVEDADSNLKISHPEVWDVKCWRSSSTKHYRDRLRSKGYTQNKFAVDEKIQEIAAAICKARSYTRPEFRKVAEVEASIYVKDRATFEPILKELYGIDFDSIKNITPDFKLVGAHTGIEGDVEGFQIQELEKDAPAEAERKQVEFP